MHGGGNHDADDIEFFFFEEPLVVIVGAGADPLADLRAAVLLGIGHGDQLDAVEIAVHPGMMPAHRTGPNDSRPYHAPSTCSQSSRGQLQARPSRSCVRAQTLVPGLTTASGETSEVE